MSLVNQDTLQHIKNLHTNAMANGTWEQSYYKALRGLEAAIALIEQIDFITKKANVEVRIDTHTTAPAYSPRPLEAGNPPERRSGLDKQEIWPSSVALYGSVQHSGDRPNSQTGWPTY